MRIGAAVGAVSGRRRSAERFDAFISYSRGDEQVAAALERAIERFATPFYRRRRLSVFRDATSMTLDPDLWESITHPMDRAEYVIVLCSRHAVASKWVNREITHCIETKGLDHLLPVVLEGTWRWDADRAGFATDDDVGVPPALLAAYAAEPLFSDLRALDRTRRTELRRNRVFGTELTKLVSRVTGTPIDQLVGEERRLRRRTVRLFAGAFAVVTALAVLAGVMAVRAITQERLAKDREQEAIAARVEAEASEARAVAAREEAEASEARAVAASRRNLANALASASGEQLDVDRSSALLLAGTAQMLDPGSTTNAALLRAVVADSRPLAQFDPWTASGDGAPQLLALSPSGRHAALARFVNGSQGSQVTFVDVADGFRVLGSVFGGSNPTVAFSADDRSAVVVGGGPANSMREGRDGTPLFGDDLRSVDLERPAAEDGTLAAIQPPPFPTDGYSRAQLSVSADGRVVAIGRRDGTLHVEDLAADSASERLVGLDVPVTAVAVSGDGLRIAAASGTSITVMATDRVDPIAVYPLPTPSSFSTANGAVALEFAGSNDRLAIVTSIGTETSTGSLWVVDALSGVPITTAGFLGELDPSVISLVVSRNGSLVAAGAEWSAVLDLTSDGPPIRIAGRILGFDAEGRRALTAESSGDVTVRSVADGGARALPLVLEPSDPAVVPSGILSAAFVPADGDSGGQIVTAGSTLVTWSSAPGPPVASFVPSSSRLVGALEDGRLLVVAEGLDARVSVVEAESGAATELAPGPSSGGPPLPVLEPGSEITTLAEVDPVTGAVVRRRTMPQSRLDQLQLVSVAPDRSTLVLVELPIGSVEAGSELSQREMVVIDASADAPRVIPLDSLGRGRAVIATFGADGRSLFVADGSFVRATDVRGDGRWTDVLQADGTISALATTPSGALLIGTSTGDVSSVPAERLEQLLATPPASPPEPDVLTHLSGVVAIWPSPDRSWAAVQSADGLIQVIDADTGELVVELPETTRSTSAWWAGDALALGNGDGIHVWDLSVSRALDRVCELAGRSLSADERVRYGITAELVGPSCS